MPRSGRGVFRISLMPKILFLKKKSLFLHPKLNGKLACNPNGIFQVLRLTAPKYEAVLLMVLDKLF
jgi:hypothetical protein